MMMIEGNSSFPLRTLGALFANESFIVLVRLEENLLVLSEKELVPLDVDAPAGCRLNPTAVAMSMRGLVSFCQTVSLLEFLLL